MPSRWVCPHCNHAAVITEEHSIRRGYTYVNLESSDGPMAAQTIFIVCPNPTCKRTSLRIVYGQGYQLSAESVKWKGAPTSEQLVPRPRLQPLDASVPPPIREDYEEASSIAQLSPKAAATLARRALQGMIRDYHSIRKPTLKQEIDALKPVVDSVVWEAIDAVRRVGNIGAHMEKDIDVIVDVEPDEAAKLLAVVELLSREWYVARKNREEALAAIVKIGREKDAERQGSAPDE